MSGDLEFYSGQNNKTPQFPITGAATLASKAEDEMIYCVKRRQERETLLAERYRLAKKSG